MIRRVLTTIACGLLLGAAVAAQEAPGQVARDGFVPLASAQMGERLPATPLVFSAYAFVWVALLTYVFVLAQKLKRVEGELAEVSRKLSPGARR